MRRTAALIVGGGPAGATAAIALARRGAMPLLIERDRAVRDALCGGFLSWATITRLDGLGVDVAALGASPVRRLALFAGGREANVALPGTAAGLSRGTLDAALLARAAAAGAEVARGLAVREIDGDRAMLQDGSVIRAATLVLATGKHELRGHARPRPPGGGTIGLRWRIADAPRLAGLLGDRIELHLFRGGYAGFVRQEAGAANLCLAVSPERFAEAGKRPDTLLAALAAECPALGVRLDRVPGPPAAQAIAAIPYGWRARSGDGRLYRIGDQAAVIPSIAGEGIDIALVSGLAAAEAILNGVTPDAFQRSLATRLARPIAVANAMWRLGEQPWGGRVMLSAARLMPALARMIARATRMA